jgi:hypothetical protein
MMMTYMNKDIIPINNIKKIEINSHSIIIIYDDNTKRTIKKDKNIIIFEKDYINTNNSPIIDHCI